MGVDFSPDGTLLAGASADASVRVWDVRSGELVAQRTVDPETAMHAELGRDRRLLTVGLDGSALLWNCDSCRPEGQLLQAAREALRQVRQLADS
jgi:WD40 repeat protein